MPPPSPPPCVLVTGGAGFVGNAVLEALRERHPGGEYRLVAADLRRALRPGSGNGGGSEEPPFEFVELDVLDAAGVERVFEECKPDAVVHTAGVVPRAAARYGRRGEAAVLRLNVGGTCNVVAAARRCGVRALVFTSSCCLITDDYTHEYPNYDEMTPVPARSLTYGESKAAAERVVLEANSAALATCALRPSVILGPGDYQLVPTIHACIAKGETPYVIGRGRNLYDFTYISNVGDAHALAVENLLSPEPTAAGEAFNISNGQPVAFRDFCLAVWAAFGHAPPFTLHIPAPLAWFAGLVSEAYSFVVNAPSTLSRGSVNDALGTRYADISKAAHLLGYRPRVGLDEGVRRSCKAYKEVLAAGGLEGEKN